MGRDKALLAYGVSNFLDHLIELLRPRVDPVIAVLGHHVVQICTTVAPRAGLQFVVNADYASGQLSSLQAGIRALPAEAPAALVALVDHPAVQPSTLDAVLARAGAALVIPCYQGRRGHPVLFSRAILDEIAGLPPAATAKQVVHAHLPEAVLLEVDDPGVVQDIDTPADYETLRV